jgi:hypothetical protein
MARIPGMPRAPEMGVSKDSKFADTGAPWQLKLATITRVDEFHMKADLKVLTGGGDQYEVDLTQGMTGPRSFWGGVPEEGSLVVIGYRRKHKQIYTPIILGYIPLAQRAAMGFEPIAPTDPTEVDPEDADFFYKLVGNTVRYKRLKLLPGDVGGMSSSGAEFTLSKDAKMSDRAGDLFELRDVDRTIITQSIHRIDSVSGVYELNGPARRGQMYLPQDIFQSDGVTLITEANRYFGLDELQATGPDVAGGPNKYANSAGKVLNFFNNKSSGDFPPSTYNNGLSTFYPSTVVGVNVEDPTTSLGARAYAERRVEMSHTTDLTQEVRGEIDGFQVDPPRVYIESVMGTVIGNDAFSSGGMRQYARLLKPKIFDDIISDAKDAGKFELQEVPRSPTEPDLESDTTAGAFLWKMKPPARKDKDTEFAVSVSKQGKLFMSVPGSTVERYPSGSKNVSAEITMEGALKMFLGQETVLGASLIVDMAGGIKAKIGHLSTPGQPAVDITYGSPVKATYAGNPSDEQGLGIALLTTVTGNESKTLTGDQVTSALGKIAQLANGAYEVRADTVSLGATGGYTGSFGGMGLTVTDKCTFSYAMVVTTTIVTGGELKTVLAGALITNVAAGAMTTSVLAGATSFACPGGAFAITVGAGAFSATVGGGAITMTAGAAVSTTAAAALSMTAGGPISITSPSLISLVSTQLLLGGPPAVLGVARGLPMMPPGTPSLDWITGLPLQGCSVVRSL